jgi:hypothetical protein
MSYRATISIEREVPKGIPTNVIGLLIINMQQPNF